MRGSSGSLRPEEEGGVPSGKAAEVRGSLEGLLEGQWEHSPSSLLASPRLEHPLWEISCCCAGEGGRLTFASTSPRRLSRSSSDQRDK
ncbi:UNVERIFIED_CONTAM: hypothetical protein Slati_1926700 [Sesamum latifolium]|uniref:Uncharacterized protein n=1 Tax=Sesamum latifolium TaxID=2727402 RepID=A0AAW2X2B5_9LAMI